MMWTITIARVFDSASIGGILGLNFQQVDFIAKKLRAYHLDLPREACLARVSVRNPACRIIPAMGSNTKEININKKIKFRPSFMCVQIFSLELKIDFNQLDLTVEK